MRSEFELDRKLTVASATLGCIFSLLLLLPSP